MKTRLTFAAFTLAALFVFTAPLHAFQNDEVWTGGGGDANWSTAANWSGPTMPPTADDFLHFAGSIRTTPNNDFSANFPVDQILFDSGAASFTLQGNAVAFFDVTNPRTNLIQNNSTNLQTLDFSNNGGSGANAGILFGGVPGTIDAASGNIRLNILNIELQSFSPHQADLTFTGSHNTTLTSAGMGIFDTFNAGGVIKNGSGTLFFPDDNNYSGGTTINAGTLQVGSLNSLGVPAHFGFLPPPNQTVLNGGTLQTTPEVPLTFNVPGDFVQNGGTLRVQIGSATTGVNNDLMQVNNSANLDSNNSHLFVHRVGTFMPTTGAVVEIITANTAVNGQFSDAPPNAPAPNDFPGLIQPFAVYNPANVELDFELATTFESQALTRNQRAVAEDMDDVVGDSRANALIAFLGNQPVGNLPHDFDLIAPEELASLYEISFSNAVIRGSNLQQRMDDIRAGSTGFCAAGFAPQVTGNTYSKDAGGKAVLDKNPAPAFVPSPENQWGIWVTGRGEYVTVGNGDDNAAGYSLDNGGATFGVDYRPFRNLAIGIYGGYDFGRGHLVENGTDTVDGANVGGYATFFTHGFYVDVAGGGGWNNYFTNRVALLGNARGTGDGTEVNAMVDLGYDWKFGCLNVGPVASFQYTNVSINQFTEQGSLAPLEIQNQDEDSLRGTAGVRVSYDLHAGTKGVIFRPEVRAAWLHEFSDQAYPINARLASGAGDVFTVFGPTIGRDAALVRAGMSVQLSPSWSIYAYYDGLLGRSNYDNNGASGGMSFGF
jgi:outer membrane autotransporter protein